MEEFKQVTQHLIEMLEELDTHFESMTQDESEYVDIKADKNAHEPDLETSSPKTQPESSDPIAKIKKTIAELKPADYGVCLICGEPIRFTNRDSVKCLGCGQILPHQ